VALQTLCFGANLRLQLSLYYFRIYISTVPCPLSTKCHHSFRCCSL